MTLSEMIRSEEYRNWESETIQDFGFSNPALFDRIQEAASEGIDGRTHAEIIEMWRDYLRNNLTRTLFSTRNMTRSKKRSTKPGTGI